MTVDGDTVEEFNEKPTTPTGFVSGGFFVLQREFLDYLDDAPDLLFEKAPLQKLARDKQLAVFPHEDFWMGMDTFRSTPSSISCGASGQAPWRVWQED
jgi:glucose-1-phosphate cytidylyltransferase